MPRDGRSRDTVEVLGSVSGDVGIMWMSETHIFMWLRACTGDVHREIEKEKQTYNVHHSFLVCGSIWPNKRLASSRRLHLGLVHLSSFLWNGIFVLVVVCLEALLRRWFCHTALYEM